MNRCLVHSSVYAVLAKRRVYFIGSILISLAAIGFHQMPVQAEWLTMETPHFLITFQAGQESVAQEAAYYAKLAHQKISEALEHEPKEKTQLVLVDPSDSANGFATPGLGYNMEHYGLVYGAPNTELRVRIESWLYTLAIHEYTHTLHIDMTEGWPALMRSIFGRLWRPQFTSIPGVLWPALTSPNGDLPVTLVEGFAVYMETINTNGGRLKDSLWEMFMRADFVQNKIMTRDQSSGRYQYSRFTGSAPFYMYGAYFCDYIARTYGQKKLYEIMHENSKGSSWFINDVFVKVLGKSWPKVWAEFIAEAKERYAQQADQIKSQPLTTMERITRTGELATSPIYSPDGSQIAYAQGGRHREFAIRLMRADGKLNHTAVTTDVVLTGEGFSWSPDGKQLVYSRSDYVGEKTVNDLYLFDLDSGRERRLTYGVRAIGPTWSPDGKTIVFVAKTSTLQTSLMAMAADGSHVRALIAGKDEMQFSSPRFSPDGKKIAVEALSFGGFEDIYLLNADGRDFHALTQDRAKDFAPSWSPDGDYILFNSDRSGVNNIYAYRVSDGQLLQVTNVLYGAFSPTMSPDGKKIAFISYDIPGYDVYTIDADPTTWKSVPYHHEKLPQPPNYAELTKDYKVRPYSPVDTLLPHFWQPIATVNAIGAVLIGQDLLGHANYLAAVSMNLNGVIDGVLRLTQHFADLTVDPDGPSVPSVSLLLSPRFIQGVFSWPFQQSMRFQQQIDLSAYWGALTPLQTPNGPVPQSGLLASGNWTMSLNGGRDSVRNFYSFSLNSTAAVTDATTGIDVGAEASATWLFDGATAFACNLDANAGPRALAVCLITMPALWLEWQLGTWPIYFQNLAFAAGVAAQYADRALKLVYFGNVVFPIYLWYKLKIEFVLGLAVGPTGLVVPIITFQFGQP